MAQLFKISLFLLIIGALDSSSARMDELEKKMIQKAMKTLGKLPGIVGQAFELYEMFENIHGMFNPPDDGPQDTDSRLDMLNDKMDKLSSDMKDFENRLSNQIYVQGVSNELQLSLKDFSANILKIDNFYKQFVDLVNDTLVFDEKDAKAFAKAVTHNTELGVNSILWSIHDIFIHNQGKSKNIPTLLLDGEITQDYMCALKQSPQQIIYTLFQKIMLTEVKGYAMLLFSHEILHAIENSERKTSHKDQAINNFKKRVSETFPIVKQTMKYASRETWKCDPGHPVENKHYARFGPVFQRYILFETDAYDIQTGAHYSCVGECSRIEHVEHLCKDTGCDPQHCYGNVRDCERKGETLSYCLADDEYRRYQYIEIDNEKYGSNTTCSFNEVNTHGEYWVWIDVYCSYCMCTCEDTTQSLDKYVSLKPVYSDYLDNKVITGAQIALKNNIFHIKIKQAVLLPNGHIDALTDDWKDDETFEIWRMEKDVDYYEIAWDTKTVCLDNLDSKSSPYKKHHVLTGLQFVNVNNRLQLAIHLSSFNFKTGIVEKNENNPKMHFNDQDERSTFTLDNLEVPIGHKTSKPRPVGDQCFELTTSDFKKDAGQNVLPFIDIQQIDTNPLSPLSGAGLFIRSDIKDETGGYLALKLFTLNLEPYMKLSEEEKKLRMVE